MSFTPPEEFARQSRIINQASERLEAIEKVVKEQAEDGGLWGVPLHGLQPITEAYLQQELRRLHHVIETGIDTRGD